MGKELSARGEPGVSVDTGEVLFSAQEMDALLRLADNPPDPGECRTRPLTDSEREDLLLLMRQSFLNDPLEDKAFYLDALPSEEAALKLMWLDPDERTRVFDALRSEQREAIASSWGEGGQVRLTA